MIRAVEAFTRLYKKSFGTFAATYLGAITLSFLWCYGVRKWTIGTSFTPNDIVASLSQGDVFGVINRVTSYPLDTTIDPLWWNLLNLVVLLPGLSHFEKMFGTLHTFMFFNGVTIVLAVIYVIVGSFASPESSLHGIFTWNLMIWGYFICQESKIGATFQLPIGRKRLPIAWIPLVVLAIVKAICRTCSVTSMAVPLLFGYSLVLIIKWKLLNWLVLPRRWLLSFENKLFNNDEDSKNISLYGIKYYKECNEKRDKKYKSMFSESSHSSSSSSLPKTNKVKTKKSKNKNKN